jgi:hypothetical protein
MTDQELINKAMRESRAILSGYLDRGHVRNLDPTMNQLVAVLDTPQLTAALERLDHATGRQGMRLVS